MWRLFGCKHRWYVLHRAVFKDRPLPEANLSKGQAPIFSSDWPAIIKACRGKVVLTLACEKCPVIHKEEVT